MTIREASIKFNLDEKEIRKRKKDNMIINVRRDGRCVVIPDDTMVIPSKKDIQSFLLQIIKYKNNNSFAISRSLCPEKEQLSAIMKYLYIRGFIGDYTFAEKIEDLFSNVQITDSGFDFVFGYGSFSKLSSIISTPIYLNLGADCSFSIVKVG